MIVDSSAMVAMLRQEPEAKAMFAALTDELSLLGHNMPPVEE